MIAIIKHHEHTLKSGQMPFVLEASAKIARAGHGGVRDWVIGYSDPIIYAQIDGETVGFIHYEWQEYRGMIYIKLSFVSEEHRRKGIHGLLYKKLREIAIKKGAFEIQAGIDIDNAAMIACAEKEGRKAFGVLYSEKLEPKESIDGD